MVARRVVGLGASSLPIVPTVWLALVWDWMVGDRDALGMLYIHQGGRVNISTPYIDISFLFLSQKPLLNPIQSKYEILHTRTAYRIPHTTLERAPNLFFLLPPSGEKANSENVRRVHTCSSAASHRIASLRPRPRPLLLSRTFNSKKSTLSRFLTRNHYIAINHHTTHNALIRVSLLFPRHPLLSLHTHHRQSGTHPPRIRSRLDVNCVRSITDLRWSGPSTTRDRQHLVLREPLHHLHDTDQLSGRHHGHAVGGDVPALRGD